MINIMQIYRLFMQDPIKMLSQRYNLPKNMNTPNDIIQHLLNTGQVTQAQVNGVMKMRDNPAIRQLLGGNNGKD